MQKIMISVLSVCVIGILLFMWSERSLFGVSLKNASQTSTINFSIKESGSYVLTIEFSGVKKGDEKNIMQSPVFLTLLFENINNNMTLLDDSMAIGGISASDGKGKVYRDIDRFLLDAGKYSISVKISEDLGILRDFDPQLKIMKMQK